MLASSAKTLVRAHGGKVIGRVPLVNGLAVKLPGKQARVLARDRRVIGLTLNTRVHGTAVADGALATRFPGQPARTRAGWGRKQRP